VDPSADLFSESVTSFEIVSHELDEECDGKHGDSHAAVHFHVDAESRVGLDGKVETDPSNGGCART
jgi:hypothetical protein